MVERANKKKEKMIQIGNDKKIGNKKKEVNKEFFPKNIIVWIVLVIAFLCVLKINKQTHIYHDEFVYSIIYGTQTKIQSILDIVTSAINLYLTHNGRMITHLVLMLFLQCDHVVRSIINSALFATLIWELIKFSTKKNQEFKIVFALLLFPMLWCTIPMFGETVIWISGAVNYLWTTVVLLFYIYTIENVYENEIEYKKIRLLGFSLLSVIVASLHEITAVISIIETSLMCIYILCKKKKINKTLLLGTVSTCIGFFAIILSPGTNVRKNVQIQTSDIVYSFFERLKNSMAMLQGTIKSNIFIFFIIAITILFIIVTFIKNRKKFLENKEIFEILFLLCASTISYLAMIVSPTFLIRVTFIPYIIFLYTGLKCFNLLNTNKIRVWRGIILLIAIGFTINTIPSVKETFELVELQKNAWNIRDEAIVLQKIQGKEDIYVEPLKVRTNSHLYYGDLSTDINYNHNGSMACYYEVNSIRLKANYYLDLGLENLNSDNLNSIKVSTNTYEEIKKIYLLDQELYEKQAPYKRFKNSYKGGNITLYFAVDDINNLEISFLKAQKITVDNMKLYTSDNTIIEAKGKDILDYVDLENIDIITENDNVIILNTQINSKIKIKV